MAKSKFFRVAVEGATASDGRKIERSWIDEAVGNFNRETYGVRVNLEHLRGFDPNSPFKAYGDVLAVKAEDINLTIGGKTEKRRALFAQIDPTDDLVAINQKRQKIYTSVEFAPNFGGTGKHGLVGLAATDNPASLGTDILTFSATNPAMKAMFDSRKQAPENIFSAGEETTFELEPDAAAGGDAGAFAAFFAGLKAAFTPSGGTTPTPPAAAPEAPAAAGSPAAAAGGFTAEQMAALHGMFSKFGEGLEKALKPTADGLAGLQGQFTDMKTKLEAAPANGFTQRPASIGGAGQQLADF